MQIHIKFIPVFGGRQRANHSKKQLMLDGTRTRFAYEACQVPLCRDYHHNLYSTHIKGDLDLAIGTTSMFVARDTYIYVSQSWIYICIICVEFTRNLYSCSRLHAYYHRGHENSFVAVSLPISLFKHTVRSIDCWERAAPDFSNPLF